MVELFEGVFYNSYHPILDRPNLRLYPHINSLFRPLVSRIQNRLVWVGTF